MNEFAVAAMGEDRPGIVAAVTRALVDVGASIEDSSMTILGGHFAMLLLVQADGDAGAVERALRPVADELDLLLEVRATSHRAGARDDRDDYVVAAYGPDRPGLVSQLAAVLADAGANISDFGSRLTDTGLFAMWFNVALPPGIDAGDLAARLGDAGGEVELDVTVHRSGAEAL